MTNLLISYPDIPFRAEGIVPSAAVHDDHPAHYLVTGPKHGQFRFLGQSNSRRIAFDLGPNVTAEANHVIIGRADILCEGSGVTNVTAQYSSDGSSWTDAETVSDLPSEDRFGPFFQDYIMEYATTPARRYHALHLTYSGFSSFQMSKLYLGKFFDFGEDPVEWEFQRREAPRTTWESASGAQHHCRSTWPRYEGRGLWTGLSDQMIADFFDKIGRHYHRNFVFLYTQTNHEMLEGHRLIYCQILQPRRVRSTTRNDWQGIELYFREVLE